MWGTTYGGFRPHPVVDAMDTWSQPCVPKVCTAIVCMEKQYWEIIYVLVHYIPVTPAGKQFICPIPVGSPISANLSFSHHVPETWKLLICTSESFILPILLHRMCLMPLVSVPLTPSSPGRHKRRLCYKPGTDGRSNISAVLLMEIVYYFWYFLLLCDTGHSRFSFFVFYYCIFNYRCMSVYSAWGLFFRLLGVMHKQA